MRVDYRESDGNSQRTPKRGSCSFALRPSDASEPLSRVAPSIRQGFGVKAIEEMSNYLAQNRLAFGLDRSVAVVTWAAKARFRGPALPGNCLGGAEVVRRMAPREPQRIP